MARKSQSQMVQEDMLGTIGKIEERNQNMKKLEPIGKDAIKAYKSGDKKQIMKQAYMLPKRVFAIKSPLDADYKVLSDYIKNKQAGKSNKLKK